MGRPQSKVPKKKLAPTQIPKDLDEALDAYCGEVKKKRAVIAMALRWFLARDDFVKTAIVGGVDRGMERIYATELRRIASTIYPEIMTDGVEDDPEDAIQRSQSAEPKDSSGGGSSQLPAQAGPAAGQNSHHSA